MSVGATTALGTAARSWVERALAARTGFPAWYLELRQQAGERFLSGGLPSASSEPWRFTPLGSMTSLPFEPAPPAGVGAVTGHFVGAPSVEGEVKVLIEDGQLTLRSATMPREVCVSSLVADLCSGGEALAPHLGGIALAAAPDPEPFRDLNTVLLSDGAVVWISGVVDVPIHVLVGGAARGGPIASHPRVLVVLDPGSQATVVETHVGAGPCVSNAVTEVSVGTGAVLHHVRVQKQSDVGFALGSLAVRVARDATYNSHVVSLGACVSRLDLNVLMDGEGGNANLHGLYVGGQQQVVDHHVSIDHKSPHCTSFASYRGILAGHSRGVFDGRIRVRRDAQKTNARLENRNLILSSEALAHSKPSLIIDADDVKCGHAATVGRLDDDALFYLRSRGIPQDSARALLTHAFARESLDGIPLLGYRQRLSQDTVAHLARAAGLGELP